MSVAFLGPLPPPVHGFSAINAAMLARLQACCDVQVFDRVQRKLPNPVLSRVFNVCRWACLLSRFTALMCSRRPTALYAGISGGLGQLMDLPFFALATAFGVPVYVHHHSFAYLNAPSKLMALCIAVLHRARHIVLCRQMGEKLTYAYGISPNMILILSNAAFLSKANEQEAWHFGGLATGNAVRIGFLSNITAEKGIFEFFAALKAMEGSNIEFVAEIAGPVAKSIEARFQKELACQPFAKHVGPVYGEMKDAFYKGIDLLLFPTRYANEAEPLTLLEAMRAGAAVVATDKGCISGMVADPCGCSPPSERFIEFALREIHSISAMAPSERVNRRRLISDKILQLMSDSEAQLGRLAAEISKT